MKANGPPPASRNATMGCVKMTVRNLAADEWRLWRDLSLRALADSPSAFRATLERERDQPDDWWAEIVGSTVEHPRGGLWVAESHQRAVGMLFGRLDPECDVLEVGAMWVAPRSRRNGVGERLIRVAMDWAREMGATRCELWVTEENAIAGSLYRNVGFRPASATMPLREASALTVRKLTAELS